MGDVKGCWRRPAMPPVWRKRHRKIKMPVQQRSLPVTHLPDEYLEPELDGDRYITRMKIKMQRLEDRAKERREKMGPLSSKMLLCNRCAEKRGFVPDGWTHGTCSDCGVNYKQDCVAYMEQLKRRSDMGTARDLVGEHDQAAPSKDQKGSSSILERLTGILDDLDTAIQAKEKDLPVEKGKEAENSEKIAKLKAADNMVRTARGLLETYNGLDQDADVIPFRRDAWVKDGVLCREKGTEKPLWRILDEETEDEDGNPVIKLGREDKPHFTAEYDREEFLDEFEEADDVIDDEF